MTVNEFIEEYKKRSVFDGVTLINEIITTDYVSYATKISDCKRIIQSTCYTNTEPNMFCMNSPARHMLFKLQLIDRYTDLEINYKNALEIYDLLDKTKVLKKVLDSIPVEEIVSYNDIMEMMLDDFQMNERSMVGYLDSKMASLGIIGETLNNLIANTVESESEDMAE